MTSSIQVTLKNGPFDGQTFELNPQITKIDLSQADGAEKHAYRRLEWDSDPLGPAVYEYQTPEQEAERDDRYGL
jgi:hypothetical protein